MPTVVACEGGTGSLLGRGDDVGAGWVGIVMAVEVVEVRRGRGEELGGCGVAEEGTDGDLEGLS